MPTPIPSELEFLLKEASAGLMKTPKAIVPAEMGLGLREVMKLAALATGKKTLVICVLPLVHSWASDDHEPTLSGLGKVQMLRTNRDTVDPTADVVVTTPRMARALYDDLSRMGFGTVLAEFSADAHDSEIKGLLASAEHCWIRPLHEQPVGFDFPMMDSAPVAKIVSHFREQFADDMDSATDISEQAPARAFRPAASAPGISTITLPASSETMR